MAMPPPHSHPHQSHEMELSPILSGTMRAFDDPPYVSLEPSPGPTGPSLGPVPGTVADPMMQPYYGHHPDNHSHFTDDDDHDDHPHRYPSAPAPPPPPPAELVRARVSYDRLPAANEKSQRNGDFSNARDWRVYLTERNELAITLPVVIDFAVDHGQPEDCSWWASLSQVNFLIPPRPGPGYAGGPSEAANYGPPEPLLDEGMISATKQREIILNLLFALPKEYVSRRNLKCKLDVTVNGVEVTGLPDTIQVRCSRQERRDEGKKRASDSTSVDSQELPPKTKRARRPLPASAAAATTTTASPAVTFDPSSLAGAASALAGLISTNGGGSGTTAAANSAGGAAASFLPFEPPPSSSAPPRIDAARQQPEQDGRPAATERDEAKLLAMISDPFHFDPDLFTLLSKRRFRDLTARQAFDLLFKTHLGALGTAWTAVHILRVLELIGGHSEVLLPTSWQESPVPYPSPMHILAKCPRPDVVDALLTYLAPPTVPTPPTRPCPDLHTGRTLMSCAHCRASATFRALSHANTSPYLPIHAAARHTNTVFVRHHIRLVGAHRTLLVPNDQDWGNVFHTVCGKMSAVHWLDEVWRTVLVGDEVRRVVGMALAMRNSFGLTPLDMARRQVEKRGGGGMAGVVQARTYDWIAERIGVPKWAAAVGKVQQSGAGAAQISRQGRAQRYAQAPAANGPAATYAYFAQAMAHTRAPVSALPGSGPAAQPLQAPPVLGAAPQLIPAQPAPGLAAQSLQPSLPARGAAQGSSQVMPAQPQQGPAQPSATASTQGSALSSAPAPPHPGLAQGQVSGSTQDLSAQSSAQGSTSPGSALGLATASAAGLLA